MPFDCSNWEPEEPRREESDRSEANVRWICAVALILVVLQVCVLVPLAFGSVARNGHIPYAWEVRTGSRFTASIG